MFRLVSRQACLLAMYFWQPLSLVLGSPVCRLLHWASFWSVLISWPIASEKGSIRLELNILDRDQALMNPTIH
jgi:hypothetical protein